ncbi:carbohydrate ABC transporter membrane protein 1, CUT1 family [Anaerocolumna jejuensis DSM 15929]|uniref:Carbohydrate ABC transporter membrane protein 1, CUT1 family n=1 Tax=Anaerocolumna jejuensis DSM 15929 TaxID=1121322 RepID=A0A1M6VT09_9FIRM|nr:ABC transporter permease subunit [Anaerocolumna jejuensis]SHK84600.1 carbohydrate ABC transporter membrane protein 1, CUT1 family [Anaerocolumna jejuensis DSM 15929]
MEKQVNAKPGTKQKKRIKMNMLIDNFQLATLTLPTIILLGIFAYWPMFGIILAFKDFKVPKGIIGSPWVDPIYKNFQFFFESQDAWRVTRNTLGLNLLFIVISTVAGVIFALIMFEVKKAKYVKIYQTASIIPSFLSWVVVGYMVYSLLAPQGGLLNKIIIGLGGEGIQWYTQPQYWPLILLISNVWHGVGIGSIIYYAALMGVDTELFEAAQMDGANKLRRVFHVSLPQLVPIITIMTLLAIGGIFRADFGLFYNVTRNQGALYSTTDVIDTYVYRALMNQGNIGMSSAVGLFQSLVCFVVLLTSNFIVTKVEPENALF